jgi:hypothetical protein
MARLSDPEVTGGGNARPVLMDVADARVAERLQHPRGGIVGALVHHNEFILVAAAFQDRAHCG